MHMEVYLINVPEIIVSRVRDVDGIYPISEASVTIGDIDTIIILNEWLQIYTKILKSVRSEMDSAISEQLIMAGDVFRAKIINGEMVSIRVFNTRRKEFCDLKMTYADAVLLHDLMRECLLGKFRDAGGDLTTLSGLSRITLPGIKV